MLDFTAFLVAVGPIALTITKLVDFIRSFDRGDTWWKGTWIVAAMVLGVLYALVVDANFAQLISGLRPEVAAALNGTVGNLATGLAIGATASAWHEPLSGWGTKSTPSV